MVWPRKDNEQSIGGDWRGGMSGFRSGLKVASSVSTVVPDAPTFQNAGILALFDK